MTAKHFTILVVRVTYRLVTKVPATNGVDSALSYLGLHEKPTASTLSHPSYVRVVACRRVAGWSVRRH